MKYTKNVIFILLISIFIVSTGNIRSYAAPKVKLGDDLLLTKYSKLIDGKGVGLITNQTGVNSNGKSDIDLLINYKNAKLVALYAPEHGIDGKAQAGAYVQSYIHSKYKIPVYSLYGDTRMPTKGMLKNVDVLIFDIQDIGSRTYTFISTLNYCMKAAKTYNKTIIVLDRPNPIGGYNVDGPMLEEKFKSFVGVDVLPLTHGMTVGELALYFNRNINAKLNIISMEGYKRSMLYSDTGLKWIPTSPRIPTIQSAFGYATMSLIEDIGLYVEEDFTWVGGKGINSSKYASLLNSAKLQGVKFIAKSRGSIGGVKLVVTDIRKFNPAKTSVYILSYGRYLSKFKIPKSTTQSICMFDKITGSSKIGTYLEKGYLPQKIESLYSSNLCKFKKEREKYLLYK